MLALGELAHASVVNWGLGGSSSKFILLVLSPYYLCSTCRSVLDSLRCLKVS